MALMDEKSDPELELGSLINLEETIKADKKTFAVINSREEEEQIKKNKPVQEDKEVVDEDEEHYSASLNKTKIRIPTKAPIPEFCYKIIFLVLLWIIFCSLMSPVRASDRPLLLAPDRCEIDWSTKPKDMQVTPGVEKTFSIKYECSSPVKKIQVVFNLDNGSTPINVWSYDGRGNLTYNPVFNGHIQVWYDLKNGIVKVTVNHLIYQGSIGVWLDLPKGRIYIPSKKDGSAVNSTSRPTTRPTTSKDGSAINATSRPTTRPTTSKENVTHPPPVDKHLAAWIIFIAVVIPLVVIVLIILLIIRYRRKIRDNIRQLRNRVLDALAC